MPLILVATNHAQINDIKERHNPLDFLTGDNTSFTGDTTKIYGDRYAT